MAATTHKGVFAPVCLPGEQRVLAPSGYVQQFQHVAVQDRAEIPSGVEINSKIYLGEIEWDFIPNRWASHIAFDDAGTGQTLDIGDVNDPDALVAGQDIAAAAGSVSFLKSVDIDKHGDPMWKLLGYADRKAAVATGTRAVIYATVKGANLGAATSLAWILVGTLA